VVRVGVRDRGRRGGGLEAVRSFFSIVGVSQRLRINLRR
jgi:hypothetical protein